jgi:multidrug efflux pump subunit AcrA (membrane-fusion protein)
MSNRQQKLWEVVTIRVVVSLLILGAGFGGMSALMKLKRPPAEVAVQESTLRVEAVTVEQGDYPVSIVAFGEVSLLNVSVISCEVSGRVVEVNPLLEVGERLGEGDVLVRIDERDYRAAREEAVASVKQLETTLTKLNLQLRYDKERLALQVRTRDLAAKEFERVRKLLENSKVGSLAAVEGAERAYNAAATQALSLEQSIELLPVQIAETEQALAGARARLARAEANLERCILKAPFDCRVKSARVELGQLAAPSQPLATLADDSTLEIHVPVDSVDARKWLQFSPQAAVEDRTWFASIERRTCRIRWTEDLDGHVWQGELHRVVDFSAATRTLVLAVRIDGDVGGAATALPLAEGMFCKVEIPGRGLESVFRVPRTAVTYDHNLYVARTNRLATVAVRVEYVDDRYSYISTGLSVGDRVVTTRLIDPLEGSLLDVSDRSGEDAS